MKKYSTEIAQAIKEHLNERDMKLVAFDETNGTFGFIMHLPGQISFVHYIIKVHKDDYTVIAVCPVSPEPNDTAAITAMAEFICRANYGLKNGNFEMDFRDGELRYKCFVDCDEQIPSQSVIRDSIAVPAAMLKRYAPGIINVMYKGMNAETAVEECENTKGLLHELEGAKRALEDLLRMRRTEDEHESGHDDVTAESDEDESFPSFEEFLRMMETSDNESEGSPEDSAENDDHEFVA